MLRNEKGFSLVQVMVAAVLLGFLSLVSMQLMKNMGQIQNFAQSKSDEIELISSIRMILDNKKFCRVSLAGDGSSGPVTFKKQDIDEDNEGLDISLYLSNQAGDARTLKKFNGENNPGTDDKSKFGKLTIKTMKLIMSNPPGGSLAPNYENQASNLDNGIIRVVVEKKVSNTRTRENIMNFDIHVAMSTGQSPESSGETRILSCEGITNHGLTNCNWESYTYSNAYRAYRSCSDTSQRAVSGNCGCGGSNCGGGSTPGYIYEFTTLNLSVDECSCVDWTCSNCNGTRTTCTGNNCNAFSCSYTQALGELYLKVLCCDML